MNPSDQPTASGAGAPEPGPGPVSFLATSEALRAIDRALRAAGDGPADAPGTGPAPAQALDSLLLLRQVREQLAGWETGLIEAARDAGASWAELAGPLGVASRQAAERRYLRGRPGPEGSTGEERVQATRRQRADDRTAADWARENAADLRRLAGQITALTGLPPAARGPVGELHAALAHDDPADLVAPLAATRRHIAPTHPELAARLDALTPP
ncbi:type III effector protein [Streptomyces filamentosus]|uniref:Type III effector protein n=1 Tax=Streptomyces filamentosus TaxID=67294 RepID=A0A919BWS0_STRFL|nr:type III effector protein [Streptomyces filamentosus]GHG24116.1 hypothetical protein GCM10017667_69640 [Streptomyces filamentosus]